MSAHNSKTSGSDAKIERLDARTQQTVDAINKVNDKATALRVRRQRDPDTLGDKFLKMAIPGLTGLVGGKVFQLVWNSVTSRAHPGPDDDAQDRRQGLMMSVVFAAASAAFSTLLTDLSDRGAASIVRRLQIRRDR